MQLEGFEFTMDMLGHAMYLRHHIGGAKHLQKWIRSCVLVVLRPPPPPREGVWVVT